MTEDQPTPTIVIFRRWPKAEGGDIIALMPELVEGRGFCTAYQHIGQHSAADYSHVVAATKPASPADYAPLLAELRTIGYLPVIRRRWNQRREKWQKETA